MGKQGPCYHCGVTSTPLWRNGPPEKPVLCNACGSRWRTKGTLAKYTPLHARAEADGYEDKRVSKVKAVSLKNGDEKLKKRKLCYDNSAGKRFGSDYSQGFLKTTYEDTSNRSSSGSALSNSDSFTQLSSADTSDLTGPSQSPVWENQVPSKKRTSLNRTKSSSPVEKFIKDLHAILHQQQSSYLSGSSEEELIFESDAPMVSVEIGHGSVLIKHPSWLGREEDSEASSLSFENKPCATNEAYARSASLSGLNGFKGGNVTKSTGKTMQEPAKRDKFNHDRLHHFVTQNSPLCHIDLNDVINFEVLLGHFTSEEQKQLLKYLPPDETSELLGLSLKNMFDSSCFKENLSHFQQLLSDGVFSNSYTGANAEDFKALKKLFVSNSTKLKNTRSSNRTQEIEFKSVRKLGLSKDLQSAKKPLQEQTINMPGKKTTEGPKRGLTRFGLGGKEHLDRGGSFLTPGSLFHLPSDGSCISPESCDNECSDQDLLLDVPSNGFFPEAELLFPPSSITSRHTSASSSSMHPAMIHH